MHNSKKAGIGCRFLVALLFFGAVAILRPATALAVSADELKGELEKVKVEDPKLYDQVKEELKDAVIKGEITIAEKDDGNGQKGNLKDTIDLSTKEGQQTALNEVAKNEQELQKKGIDVGALREAILNGGKPEDLQKIFEKNGAPMEGHGEGKDFFKEVIAGGKEIYGHDEKGMEKAFESLEKLGIDTKDMREMGSGREAFEKMTPEEKVAMAEKMGVSPEQMKEFAEKGGHEFTPQEREVMEHMGKEGFERGMMERETMEHGQRELGDRERAEFERFAAEREHFERPELERPILDRQEFQQPPQQPPQQEPPPPPPGH